MIQTVNLHDFREAFRSCRPESFSYDGLEILFDYFEQYEDETGENIELDVIAICCDFSEDSPETIADYYAIDIEGLTDEEISEKVRNHLEENGAYIGSTDLGMIVYRQF